EIAEVYGSIEGKPKTQTLYQRDPIKDTLERTLVESKYLKILQKFTGISRERLDAELLSRKLFIESMVQKNIRGLGEVSEKAKNYIIEREMGD
ncbi:MAG: hypothetical protein NTY48_03800, partial [Candidatus Diapherotrites archaeon]|nr:hypothetical protein [Candidatus Diapherotrites archaeon]